MNLFLIYNNFFYKDFENKTRKIRKINICERRVLYISYIFAYLLLLAVKTPEDDLVKFNSFPIGDFIFMLNTDWIAKKQLNVNSVNKFYKHLKRNQNSTIEFYNLTDLIDSII